MADLTEHRLSSSCLLRGKFLRLFRDSVRLPDGGVAEREYVKHPGAVMIVPLLEATDGSLQVVLERQYRYPVQRTMIEFPAGKLDAGEDALACAQRELMEETGYRAGRWAHAGRIHLAIGYSDEVIEIWFARDLRTGARRLDAGEFLEVFVAPVAQVQDWCRSGEVTDSKTLIGMLWVQNMLNGTWAPKWQDSHRSDPSTGRSHENI